MVMDQTLIHLHDTMLHLGRVGENVGSGVGIHVGWDDGKLDGRWIGVLVGAAEMEGENVMVGAIDGPTDVDGVSVLEKVGGNDGIIIGDEVGIQSSPSTQSTLNEKVP